MDDEPTTETDAPGVSTAEAKPTERPARRWRSRTSVVLVILMTISLFASGIGTWAHNTLLNTDRYVKTVTPIADDPRVTEALATELTNQITAAVDLEALAQRVLPDRADGLALPISSAIQQYMRQVSYELLQSEQFKKLWVQVNTKAHEAAVKLLRNEATQIDTTNGVVTLDLIPLITRILSTIDQRIPSFLGGPRGIPQIEPGTDPEVARAELSAALGRDLKPGFGQIVLFRSEQLAAAQKAVAFFDKVIWVLWSVTALLAVAALVLSQRRWRTLAQIGIGAAIAAATATAITRAVQNRVADLILDPEKRAATSAAVGKLVVRLDDVAKNLLWAGVALAVVGYLLGDGRGAVAIRRTVRNLIGGRSTSAEGVAAPRGVGVPFVHDNLGALQAAGVVLALVALLVLDLSLGGLLTLGVLLLVYEAALALLSDNGTDVSTESPSAT